MSPVALLLALPLAAEATLAEARNVSVTVAKLRALRRESGSPAPSLSRSEGEGWEGVPLTPDQKPAPAPTGQVQQSEAPLPGPPLAHAQREGAKPSAAQSIESLRRLLGVRARVPVLGAAPRGPIDRSLPGNEIAPGLWQVDARVPMAFPDDALSLAFARRDDAVDPADVLFFDTETTGLAGGTGTRAFMIGAADWHRDPVRGDGLRVRQLLIATMAAEPAMLATFASWLSPRTVLSSYNGRCYDAPLLKTRYRLARMADPIAALDHVDLLFPSRRRWRGRWENCRLATIEREALGVLREDDLPGAQAPAAWLHYLRGGSASLLGRVAAHNHQDVVTLALLMRRLVALHDDDDLAAG